MAITANGYIAKIDDDTGFVTDKEWESYNFMVRKAGCVIMGYKTYKLHTKSELEELGNIKVVIVSEKKFPTLDSNHIIVHSPKEALTSLREFKEVIIAGGSILNSSFMKENLIDEIYLDVEPILIGKGIKLFSESDFEVKLELISVKNISKNELQLHYSVIR